MATVHVALIEESVDVWRPVEAIPEGESIYRLADVPMPDGEVWEFGPGALVRCEWRDLFDGPALVAISPA